MTKLNQMTRCTIPLDNVVLARGKFRVDFQICTSPANFSSTTTIPFAPYLGLKDGTISERPELSLIPTKLD